MRVRFLTPRSRRAAIRFSGMPQRPKPETMMEAPSGMSLTAAAASFTTLFIREGLLETRGLAAGSMISRSGRAPQGPPGTRDLGPVLAQDLAPERARASGQPGHVPEARARQAQMARGHGGVAAGVPEGGGHDPGGAAPES